MRRISRLRPSASMVVAVIALVVACAGSATAASLITGKQIKNNSVTSADIKNRSLLKKDFKKGQVPRGPRGLKGEQGPQGAAGPAGRAGRDGTDGFGRIVYSQGISADPIADAETGETVYAICPTGTFPTGGDAFYVDAETEELVDALPVASQGLLGDGEGSLVGWAGVPAENDTGGEVLLVVDAICANADEVGFATTEQPALRATQSTAPMVPFTLDRD